MATQNPTCCYDSQIQSYDPCLIPVCSHGSPHGSQSCAPRNCGPLSCARLPNVPCMHRHYTACYTCPESSWACVFWKKSNMRHPRLLRHYGEPGLVAPPACEACLSGACLTFSAIPQTVLQDTKDRAKLGACVANTGVNLAMHSRSELCQAEGSWT